MKKLMILFLLIPFWGVSQINLEGVTLTKDSVISVKDRSYAGVPMGVFKPDFSDTTMVIHVRYNEGIDDKAIINETLIRELNMDTVKKYMPKMYDRIMLRFFNSLQYSELEVLSKEAAKERFFGYKKYFK
jgi:hypothetical protein